MTQESAVQFQTASRVHMGLAVRNLPQSLAFYRAMFGQEPAKTHSGYAKFETAEPPFNLALNQVGGATGPNNPVSHFGIQVKSTAAVEQYAERLRQAGIATTVEDGVTCCYAVQNKIWAVDPDGNKWEVYVVLDDAAPRHQSTHGECCSGLPAVMRAVESGDMPAAKQAFREAGGMSACSCLVPQTADNEARP